MNHEPTQTPNLPDAFEAMATLFRTHPGLPNAYTVIDQHTPEAARVQVRSLAALETWRDALGVDPFDVDTKPHGNGTDATVQFFTTAGPVQVCVYTVEQNLLPAPVEAVAA